MVTGKALQETVLTLLNSLVPRSIRLFVLMALMVFSAAGCSYLSSDAPMTLRGFEKLRSPDARLDFSTLSNVVLQPKCIECHKPFRHGFLNSPAAVQSKIDAIRTAVFVTREMPELPVKLSDCESEMLKAWLDDGAPETSERLVSDLPACAGDSEPQPTPEPTPSATPIASPTPDATPELEVTFTEVFDNVISVRCLRCHNGEDVEASAFDVPLNTAEQIFAQKLIIPGSPESSRLIKSVLKTGMGRMPPRGDALTPDQIELLQNWVKSAK